MSEVVYFPEEHKCDPEEIYGGKARKAYDHRVAFVVCDCGKRWHPIRGDLDFNGSPYYRWMEMNLRSAHYLRCLELGLL